MRLGTLVIVTLMLAPLATAASQKSPSLKPGDRIRVITPSASGGPFVGTLVTLEADSLVMQGSVDARRLSLASVERVDLSRGRKSHARLGAGIGLLVGAGVGALAGCDQQNDQSDLTQGQCIVMGAAAGALLGAITGALVRTERWMEIPRDGLRMSFTSDRGRTLTLRVSLSF